MNNQKAKIIAVVGPTGSGKTALGVVLAKKFNGEIVSADSRQIYRHLDISTGKEGRPNAPYKITNSTKLRIKQKSSSKPKSYNLTADSYAIDGVPQHLIDICQPGERFTLFDWLTQAKITIADIIKRGKVPIVVGGTGLYVSALLEGYGLRKLPNSKSETLNKFKIQNSKFKTYSRQELEGKTLGELKRIYGERITDNPPSLKLRRAGGKPDLNNPYRLIRAIEKAQAGEQPSKQKSEYECLCLMPDIERGELYRRIDQRVEERFKAGMVNEITDLVQNKILKIKNKIYGKLSINKISLSSVRHPELDSGSRIMNGFRIKSGMTRRGGGGDDTTGCENINQEMAEWLVSLGLDIRILTEYLLENDFNINNQICHSELDSESIKTGSRIPTSLKLRGAGKCGMTQKTENNRDQKYQKMKERFKFAEHAYARRQLTWWRHHQPKPVPVKGQEEAIELVEKHLLRC